MVYKYFPVTIMADGRKLPLIKDWQNQATSDPVKIEQWREQFRDRLTHFGIPTGPTTGILVLDVDTKDPEKNGYQSLADNHIVIPQTASQKTISGGGHFIFQCPNDGEYYGNRAGVYPGVDIRGQGGYIVAYDIDNTPVQPAPEWLVKASKNTYQVPEGTEIQMQADIAEERFQNALQQIREAPDGERNTYLNTEVFKIAQLVQAGGIAKSRAIAEAQRVATEIGLDAREIVKTIESGFKGGTNKPLACPFNQPPPPPAGYTPPAPTQERWTPKYFSAFDLANTSHLKRPQLFKDWSTQDIHITTADGGTGKTTLKLMEAICLALGDRFLGFECVTPGKTLFITGEDTALKLGAMIGAITRQMGIANDVTKMNKVLDSIVVKKDADLCLISKDKQGFLHASTPNLNKVLEAVEDIKPKMIVFDPISSFWGSESALNDMAKAVSKFMSALVEASDACVEMINHMGKQSSNNKDMSQFAGRGGTGLPSHARVSRVIRPLSDDEYAEMTDDELPEGHSAMLCNINKFSDGSPLLNKPFIIIRNGFLFTKRDVDSSVVREEKKVDDDNKRVFSYIKDCRDNNQWVTKDVIVSHFMTQTDKISEARVKRALNVLAFVGYGKQKIRPVQGPDAELKDQVYIITDLQGNELTS